jgi:hypothetical protein
MLKIFPAKVDHPLADPKEASRVVGELPTLEASAALDSATAWLESLAATSEFPAEPRLDLVLQIDEAVLPHTRRQTREYLTTPRQTRAWEHRFWQINHGYWLALVAAYQAVLQHHLDRVRGSEAIRSRLALLCARLLHACGQELKWARFRYGPIEGDFWLLAGGVYLEAAKYQVAKERVVLYANAPETTPESEYLRVLILYASSMDSLLPLEMEIAERLIAHLLPNFALSDEARPENVYWIDAAKPLPPTRLARIPEITPTLRLFATGVALEDLGRLRAAIVGREALPTDINFGGQYSPRVVLPVIDHLAVCWAPKPPMRSHERRRIRSRMAVVHGLDSIREQLLDEGGDLDAIESWIVEDVSQGGIGGHVSLVGKEWLRVGVLLGMQPQGGENWLVGVVRRFNRDTDATGSIGIETLSKTPIAMQATTNEVAIDMLLLDTPSGNGGEVRGVLTATNWEEHEPLQLEISGRRWRLFPSKLMESGAGYIIGSYRAEAA